jgi:hypothetical protein
MPLDSVAAALSPSGVLPSPYPRLLLIDPGVFCRGDTASAAAAALAAADIVLHETAIAPGIAALVPRGTLVEPVPADASGALTKRSAMARASRLASEGWRVVWLASGGPDALALDFAKAGLAVANDIPDAGVASGDTPHLLATSLNGLAG